MDKNGDGALTYDELRAGLHEIPEINLTEVELLDAMQIIDANQNGLIDYTEFIAACLQSYNYLQESHLRSAFAYFDQDNSGQISAEELRLCLQSDDFTLTEEQIQQLLEGVDTDGDGQIDYLEFINMMKNSLGMEIRMDNPAR
jgi:Ca2+-binding EF-hand superfamily protein